MITSSPFYLITFTLLHFGLTLAQAEEIHPVIYKISGDVSTRAAGRQFEPASSKQALDGVTEIRTGASSNALLAIAPGASLKLKDNSVISAHQSVTSSKEQSSLVDLLQGDAVCLLRHSEGSQRNFKVSMGDGEAASAQGTSWQSTKGDAEKQVIVATGTVSWDSKLDTKPILIGPGCLMISTYDESKNLESLIIINLRDGSYTEYPANGGAPTTTKATLDQLTLARGKFQALVNEVYNSLPPTERAELNLLLEEINTVLSNAGLNPIDTPAPEIPLPGPSNNPSDEVTPVRPQL